MSIRVEKNPLNKIEKDIIKDPEREKALVKAFEEADEQVRKDIEESTRIEANNITNIIRLIMTTATSVEDGERIFFDYLPVILEDERVQAVIANQSKEGPRDNFNIDPKILDKMVNDMRESLTIKENMKSSPEYIEWLVNFTKKQNNFEDNKWLYFPDGIQEKDRENVSKLDKFFGIIDDYARDKKIAGTEILSGYCYYVRYKDTILEIGAYEGQGIVNYASVVSRDIVEDMIDFDKILLENREDKNLEDYINNIEEKYPYPNAQKDNKIMQKSLIFRPEDEE